MRHVALGGGQQRDVLAVDQDAARRSPVPARRSAAGSWSCRSRMGRAASPACRAAIDEADGVDGGDAAIALGDARSGQRSDVAGGGVQSRDGRAAAMASESAHVAPCGRTFRRAAAADAAFADEQLDEQRAPAS